MLATAFCTVASAELGAPLATAAAGALAFVAATISVAHRVGCGTHDAVNSEPVRRLKRARCRERRRAKLTVLRDAGRADVVV